MLGLLFAASVALAGGYYVESAAVPDREQVGKLQEKARAVGMDVRIVRRFRLGHGWEFVLLAEGLDAETDATVLAGRMTAALDLPMTVYHEEGTRSVPVTQPVVATPEAEEPAMTAAQWLARVDDALGGVAGGARALALAPAVHFVYERRFDLDGKPAVVKHDYWRDGTHRRLDVRTGGAGKDSVAITSATGAWLVVDGAVSTRDIGVLVGTIDGFAPEAVLALPLGAHDLLAGASAERFQVLEGAVGGVRLGQGAETEEEGLAWLDVDPETARPVRARYVTEAGPLEWEFKSWKQVTTGVTVPFEATVTRADGSRETISVTRLDVVATAPEGTFALPQP